MKLPKTFIIKGEEYQVLVAEIDNDTWGLTDDDKRTITLSPAIKGKNLKLTLIHEFIHACLSELHVDLESGVEEVIADGLAKCLLDSFQVRPKQ